MRTTTSAPAPCGERASLRAGALGGSRGPHGHTFSALMTSRTAGHLLCAQQLPSLSPSPVWADPWTVSALAQSPAATAQSLCWC